MQQNMSPFEQDTLSCLKILKDGSTILYPTDTIWGIGCDATNGEAVKKVYDIKRRPDSKSMIVLVADEQDILQYAASPDLKVFEFIRKQTRPTTIIFEKAVNLPAYLIAQDGSIAMRIVQDEFCKQLIRQLGKPIVSTSANISGEPAPQTFSQIAEAIRQEVDYIVRWRQDDETPAQPSQIIKWNNDGTKIIIRQ